MPTVGRSQFLAHSHGEAQTIHQSLRDDPEVLERLQFQGIQCGLGKLYQARCCPGCGSTINAEVTAGQAIELLAQLATVVAQTLSQLELPKPQGAA